MERLTALADRWKAEADTAEQRYGDERVAHLLRLLAAELEEAVRVTQEEPLTLDEAATVSGYTVDHLRHLVADRAIPNAGRKGAPRIRRADLPIKPGFGAENLEDEAARAAQRILGKRELRA